VAELGEAVLLSGRSIAAIGLAIAIVGAAIHANAQSSVPEPEPPGDPPPPLPAAVLKDNDVIARGEKIWGDQCKHCHGAKAYPGKAPKLQPRTYKPEFVWDRIHNGFRAMPPWKDVYKPDEIIALVAFILSDDFFP